MLSVINSVQYMEPVFYFPVLSALMARDPVPSLVLRRAHGTSLQELLFGPDFHDLSEDLLLSLIESLVGQLHFLHTKVPEFKARTYPEATHGHLCPQALLVCQHRNIETEHYLTSRVAPARSLLFPLLEDEILYTAPELVRDPTMVRTAEQKRGTEG